MRNNGKNVSVTTKQADCCGLNDLPVFSKWPERILGFKPCKTKKRNSRENLREYEKEKYLPLLEKVTCLNKRKKISIKDVIKMEVDEKTEMLCCVGEKYETLPFWKSFDKNVDMISCTLKKYSKRSKALVELGAGYGRTIFSLMERKEFSHLPVYAYEYTDSGSKILKLLANNYGAGLNLGRCDFMTPGVVDKPIPERALIFTYYAVCNIPEIDKSFFDVILSFNPEAVVHLEPFYEHCDEKKLIDLMRKRYIELNDLNKNLVTLAQSLERDGRIEILEEKNNLFSRNPLLACSVLAWRSSSRKRS